MFKIFFNPLFKIELNNLFLICLLIIKFLSIFNDESSFYPFYVIYLSIISFLNKEMNKIDLIHFLRA